MVIVDVLKLPLIDILASEIKPVDLYDTLQSVFRRRGHIKKTQIRTSENLFSRTTCHT